MAQIETEHSDADIGVDPEPTKSACCSTAEQATCCEASEKSACCGTPDPASQPAARCGCR